jgi:hypothetical protein
VAKAGNTSHRQKWREPRLDSQIITSRTVRKGTCPSGSTNIRVASTPFHDLRQPKASISLVMDRWCKRSMVLFFLDSFYTFIIVKNGFSFSLC